MFFFKNVVNVLGTDKADIPETYLSQWNIFHQKLVQRKFNCLPVNLERNGENGEEATSSLKMSFLKFGERTRTFEKADVKALCRKINLEEIDENDETLREKRQFQMDFFHQTQR